MVEPDDLDPGVTLVELLAWLGDVLSAYQDRIADEAALGTQRRLGYLKYHVLSDADLVVTVDGGLWRPVGAESEPADYDRTIAEHAAWKAEQVNAGIQSRIDRAFEETSRLTDRITSDKDYMAGFSAGVEAMKAIDLSQCGALLSRDFGGFGAPPQGSRAPVGPEAQQRFARGFQDGQKLIFGLESIRRLPSCFTRTPEAPASRRISN